MFTRETQLAAAEPCAWNTPAGRRHGGSQQRPRSFAMDDLEAAATLKSLATGLDPATGAPLAAALASLATVHADMPRLVAALVSESRPGDHLVLMSNGSFGGLHERLLAALRARGERAVAAGEA